MDKVPLGSLHIFFTISNSSKELRRKAVCIDKSLFCCNALVCIDGVCSSETDE